MLGITSIVINLINLRGKKIKINQKDSFKFLGFSQNKQAKSFEIGFEKQKFPYLFMDSYEKLYYIGKKPDIHYFDNITKEEYEKIDSLWVAKDETVKYLKRDCQLQYEILNLFFKDIQSRYAINAKAQQT